MPGSSTLPLPLISKEAWSYRPLLNPRRSLTSSTPRVRRARRKGVAIEHGSLTNLLRSMMQEPGITAQDTLLAITTVAFDIAALELLLPLLTGAKLVIATRDQVKDPALLLMLLAESRTTVLQATPGVWRALIDAGWNSNQRLKAPLRRGGAHPGACRAHPRPHPRSFGISMVPRRPPSGRRRHASPGVRLLRVSANPSPILSSTF